MPRMRELFEEQAMNAGFSAAQLVRDGEGYADWDASSAYRWWRLGVAHLIDLVPAASWVCEWGAVSLPVGDPSRITAMSAHATEAEALAHGEASGFDWQVYPAYCVAGSKNKVLAGRTTNSGA